jgi:hydroxyacylglutathione hydrolase
MFREHPATDHRAVLGEGVQLVDVREPREVMSGTLPGAVNIPLGELPNRVAELDPSRRVVVLCRSGNRSGHAGRWLAGRGFADVVNLSGGMLALERAA